MSRVGEENYNSFGSRMVITAYRKSIDIDVFFPKYNWTYYSAVYSSFKKGSLICPYEPKVFNRGYIGEGKYVSRINKQKTKEYNVRYSMFFRCYDEKHKDKRTTYDGCEVCEEWLNFQNFAEWFQENYYEIENEKMCLDKDILIKGNKIYSPQTCVFAPNDINVLFTKTNKLRGTTPIGVTWHKRDKVYEAHLSMDKKCIYLGKYDTPEEAFQAYKIAKEKNIKRMADKYKDKIPQKLYDAMYKYEVEITD